MVAKAEEKATALRIIFAASPHECPADVLWAPLESPNRGRPVG